MKSIVISIVRDDGHGNQLGLKSRDIIYQVNGRKPESPADVTNATSQGPAQLLIIRGEKSFTVKTEQTTLGIVLNESEFDEEGWLIAKKIQDVILSTAPEIPGRQIIQTLDIVGAQCIYGVNAMADLAAGIREMIGGRSQGLQHKIAEARAEVCNELRQAAFDLGGNGVISTTFHHAEIGDKGGFMLMVTATGTAVIAS